MAAEAAECVWKIYSATHSIADLNQFDIEPFASKYSMKLSNSTTKLTPQVTHRTQHYDNTGTTFLGLKNTEINKYYFISLHLIVKSH